VQVVANEPTEITLLTKTNEDCYILLHSCSTVSDGEETAADYQCDYDCCHGFDKTTAAACLSKHLLLTGCRSQTPPQTPSARQNNTRHLLCLYVQNLHYGLMQKI